MPTDVSSLTIEVDSRDVRRGTTDLNNFSQQGRRTETATGRLQGSFNMLRVAVASLGGVIGLLSFGKTIAEFQALERALGVVFGSVEDGVKVMEDLQKIATETPFSINELAQSVIKLRSSGIEPTNAQLKLFADIASVTTDKVGTLTAMTDLFARSTAGGLGLEDLNRLADRGIPVFTILKDTLGLARSEVAEFGKTSEGSRKILETLTDDLQERFGGAALDASRDLAVVWSNLGIAFGNLQKEIGDSGGINIFTKAVEGAIKVINFFTADLGRLYTVLGTITAFAIPAIILGIRAIGVAIMANPIGLIITAMTLATLAAYEFRREIGNTIVKTFEVFIPNALDHARIAFINLEVGIGNLMNGMLESINDFANDLITNSPKWLQDFLGISGDSFRLGIDVNAALSQIDELQNAIAGRTRNFTNPFMMPTATSDTGGGLIDSDSLTGVQYNTGAVGSGMRGPGTGGMTEEEESRLAERINREMQQREEENERLLDDKNRKLKAEKDYYDRLFNLQAGSQQAGLDFGNAIREMDYKSALSNGALMIGNLAQSSNSMFKIQKAFALANAVVTLPSAVMKSFDNGGGYPFGLIPAGLMLAKGMQQISAIRSSSFSGGGSTPSVGSGSTSPSVPVSSGLPNGSTAVPEGIEQPAPQVRELRVSIEGDGPHSEGMRKFAVNLAETIKDMGGTTNLVIS
jgi:Flp pilus assembly protein TadB